ncbi:sex-determining region Y protein [Nematostella vectensis]|nr:sex-determining region Y protein [Nematostella vectensis]
MSAEPSAAADDLKSSSEKIKRPLNAFILWSKKRRRVIANENPQMHNFDISRKLGLEWQKLTEEEKAYYFEEAKKLKEEHKERYPHYKYQPRKRDKTNKRGKMFHGSPFHFGFFPPSAPFYEGRFPTYALPSESRLPYPHLETPVPMAEPLTREEATATSTSSTSPAPSKPSSSPGNDKPTVCPVAGFRPPSESFVSYRSFEPPYMHLRPNMEFSHWHSGSPPARFGTVPHYGCLYPWYSRPDYHA